jgi:Sec-independent protein translocase protein TatA
VNSFFGIGLAEMMAILAIAILVIGPARMVTFGRTLGRILRRMRSISGEFLGSIQEELAETQAETREAVGGLMEDGAGVSAEIEATKQETDDTLEDAGGGAVEAATSMKEELTSFAQEAQEALRDIGESFAGFVKAEAEKPDTEDDDDQRS